MIQKRSARSLNERSNHNSTFLKEWSLMKFVMRHHQMEMNKKLNVAVGVGDVAVVAVAVGDAVGGGVVVPSRSAALIPGCP